MGYAFWKRGSVDVSPRSFIGRRVSFLSAFFLRTLQYRFVRAIALLAIFVGATVVLIMVRESHATSSVSHPWSGVGDGTFAVTGPTALRTYTFPDASSVVMAAPAFAQGDLLYASGTNAFSILAKNATATRYLSNTGTSNNPAWAQIDLTNGVTGTLPGGNGGTNNAFMAFSGPATSLKTFTLPNATSTILTDNAAVTLTQGGSSKALTASNGGIVWTDADSMEVLAGTATANKVLMSGATATPSWSTPTYPNASATAGKVIISDGTNYIASTLIWPDATGTIGNQVTLTATGTIGSIDLVPELFVAGGTRPKYYFYNTGLANTNATSNAAQFTYMGKAKKAYTSCDVRVNVTAAYSGNTITWAEVGIYTGALPGVNQNATLTRRGTTSVVGSYNSTGLKTTTISVSGITQGDDLWFAHGSQTSGGTNARFTLRSAVADEIPTGMFQVQAASGALSSLSTASPSANAGNPAWVFMKCT